MNTSPKKEFSLEIDGQTYLVKIEELACGGLAVELDGKIHLVSMADLARQQDNAHAPKSAKLEVPVPAASSQPARRPAAAGADHLSAPMPGDIVQIMVKAGDQVATGQEVCVLEAMKMKNILRASRNAVVKSIEVSIGQSVNYGDVLVRFEA